MRRELLHIFPHGEPLFVPVFLDKDTQLPR